MSKSIDYNYLIGKHIGSLLVISSDVLIGGRKKIRCICSCGKELFVRCDSIHNIKSCGCQRNVRKGISNNLYIDGRSKEKLYNLCFSIKNRVGSPNCKEYKHYGGRGIKMCKEWYDYQIFRKWAFENGYENKLSIERTDNNSDYCPENCKWVTMLEQGKNKRNTRLISYQGENKTIREWCELLSLKYGTEKSRIYRNFYKTGNYKLTIE